MKAPNPVLNIFGINHAASFARVHLAEASLANLARAKQYPWPAKQYLLSINWLPIFDKNSSFASRPQKYAPVILGANFSQQAKSQAENCQR